MIAICPKVRDAKRILKHLDWALKEGYKPKEEKRDREGKPKRQLLVSATKEEGSREDSGPSKAEEGDPSGKSIPSVDKEESGIEPPETRARIRGKEKAQEGPSPPRS